MHISQQTFSRIIKKAHKTMADGVVNGKIIKLQGGSYVTTTHPDIKPEAKIKSRQTIAIK